MTGQKVLLLGAGGQVGTELRRSFSGAPELLACGRQQADLSRPEKLRDLVREFRPDVILNAAAYTAVDRAESEPDLAMMVNAAAPGVLAEEAARLGALLVHYSTDYVFDGTKSGPWLESDATGPLNVYGRSKLAGEEAIQRVGGRYFIFRTSWVYGPHGSNFLLTMLRLGRERPQLRIVDDQTGAPTSSIEISRATHGALKRAPDAPSGIYHMSCGGWTSWYGFACAIFRQAGTSAELLPIPSEQYPTPARRPRNSVLSNEKLRAVFGVELAGWEEALQEVFPRL
jgi:dTDP-4-dehydrorhamnose reductase